MIGAPYDVADPHIDVVHDDAEMICRMFVRTQQDEIFDRLTFDGDLAEYRVFKCHASFRNSESDGAFVFIGISAADKTIRSLPVEVQTFRLVIRSFIPMK